MAEAIQVPGAVHILIAIPGQTLAGLGWSNNGVSIIEEKFHENVHGDQNGGDGGPPIDIQYYGEIHRIRLELITFDEAVKKALLAVVSNGTPGIRPEPGTLMLASGSYFRCLLRPRAFEINGDVTHLRNYPRCFVRGQPEFNSGSKHMRATLELECHAPSGPGDATKALWNTDAV